MPLLAPTNAVIPTPNKSRVVDDVVTFGEMTIRLSASIPGTMSVMVPARLFALPVTLQAMEDEALGQGFDMIARLRMEWESGVNRFDRDGETLLGTFRDERLIGIGGLSRDPYVTGPGIARLRHLHVMKDQRRTGVGKDLVERILVHARGNFDVVRLWTDRASVFYDALGFDRVDGLKVTHVYSIRGSAPDRESSLKTS